MQFYQIFVKYICLAVELVSSENWQIWSVKHDRLLAERFGSVCTADRFCTVCTADRLSKLGYGCTTAVLASVRKTGSTVLDSDVWYKTGSIVLAIVR